MDFNFDGIVNMTGIVVVAMLIVLAAMMIDLASGLYKAKLRGEIRTSEGLRRTLMKFITYEGGMMIAAGVDALITMSELELLFKLDALYRIPVVTILVGIFLLVVEFLSVREKADEKTKKNFGRAESLAIKAILRPENKELLIQLLEIIQREDGVAGASMDEQNKQHCDGEL